MKGGFGGEHKDVLKQINNRTSAGCCLTNKDNVSAKKNERKSCSGYKGCQKVIWFGEKARSNRKGLGYTGKWLERSKYVDCLSMQIASGWGF